MLQELVTCIAGFKRRILTQDAAMMEREEVPTGDDYNTLFSEAVSTLVVLEAILTQVGKVTLKNRTAAVHLSMWLVAESAWFQMTPLPDDEWEFMMRMDVWKRARAQFGPADEATVQ